MAAAGVEREIAAARRAAVMAVVGFGIAVVIMATAQGGPAYFLQLGPKSPGLATAREVLGDDVPTPVTDGHDGDFFWQLARDPLLRDDDGLSRTLDRPIYRAQRIAYPLLAAPWRAVGEQALLWGMVLTNVAAVGVGTYLVGRWSAERGGPGLLAYAFAFNPLAWLSVLFDLCDAVALLGLVGALYGFDRRRPGLMVAGAVLGVLAKEPMLLGLAGAALLCRGRDLRERVLLVAPAAVAAGAWRLYVLSRSALGTDPEVQEFTKVPFAAFRDAWRWGWWPEREWELAVVCLGLLLACLACIWLWARDRHRLELAAALPFALIAPFLSIQVVSLWVNLVRGVGAVLLLVPIHLVLRRTEVPSLSSA